MHVKQGSSLSNEQRQQLTQRIRDWMRAKGTSGCAQCGEEAYEVGDFQVVFFLGAGVGAQMGRDKEQNGIGSHRTDLLAGMVNELDRLKRQLKRFGWAAQECQAVRIYCGNCGYVLLLDSEKVGVNVGYRDPLEG